MSTPSPTTQYPTTPLPNTGSAGEAKRVGRRSGVWLWALAVLAIGAIALGAAGLDWRAVAAVLSGTHAGWFAAVCAVLVLPVLMAAEWRLIEARAAGADSGDFRSLLSVAALTYFLQTYLNAAVAYGTALVRLVRSRGWKAGEAIGLVTVDQAAEGISRILFCGVVFSPAASTYSAGPLGWGAVALAVVAAVCLAANRAKALVHRSVARRLSRLGHAAAVLDDVLAVVRLRSFAWGVTLAMGKKVVKFAAIVAAERAVGVEGSLWTAVYFLAVLECATVLPLVPGHLGVIESTAATVYAMHGFSAEVGLSIGVLFHAGLYLATSLVLVMAAIGQAVGGRKSATGSDAAERPAASDVAGTFEGATPDPRSSAA